MSQAWLSGPEERVRLISGVHTKVPRLAQVWMHTHTYNMYTHVYTHIPIYNACIHVYTHNICTQSHTQLSLNGSDQHMPLPPDLHVNRKRRALDFYLCGLVPTELSAPISGDGNTVKCVGFLPGQRRNPPSPCPSKSLLFPLPQVHVGTQLTS